MKIASIPQIVLETPHAISPAQLDPFRQWGRGYGVIPHSTETQQRLLQLGQHMSEEQFERLIQLLAAADRLALFAMWLVVHCTYARRVRLDGAPLLPEEFKKSPQGHTGGSLNMVPAYVGYLAANALTGETRSWIMGQGHCVAAIDAVNIAVRNLHPEQEERYPLTESGLTRLVGDFYSYRMLQSGQQEAPLGSHVNAHTAGGIAEGGYLGFTELQYVHMPLPGETVVAFLSDGAFEEQRGSDWAPRWWRAEDCGFPVPIMIQNGRRIDQRTTVAQSGGTSWLADHLRLNQFDPLVFDGRDPAAFLWAILEIEMRLLSASREIQEGRLHYPVRLPYGIAQAPKGAGFLNEGSNLAHNLPLGANPSDNSDAARQFHLAARKLWVDFSDLLPAADLFQNHHETQRPLERDHSLATRHPSVRKVPVLPFAGEGMALSPMDGIDEAFLGICKNNPHLRPRVGNPDEMRSNHLRRTLESLHFRVTDPEPGMPESLHGAVITALNEEAVVCAAIGNKGGLNLVATYEAFAPKMHGAVRQEINFAHQCACAGRPPGWISWPLVLTSHTWENGKNEYSHQDTAMAELMMHEWCDRSRVLFIPDFNVALAVLENLYQTRGQIWTLVVPKSKVPVRWNPESARTLVQAGAQQLPQGFETGTPRLLLIALGAFQLNEVLKASEALEQGRVAHRVIYLLEPGRFREPRGESEAGFVESRDVEERLFPPGVPRIFVSHTRPDALRGILRGIDSCPSAWLGYQNQGGTLNLDGMLRVNHCASADIVASARALLGDF